MGERVEVEAGGVRFYVLKDLLYAESDEWVKKGEAVATLDSIKTTADVYSPVTGEVVEVNERLLEEPELINKDPYGDGWIFAVKLEDPGELEQLLTWEKYVENVKKRKESG